MATQALNGHTDTQETKTACFLCILDSKRCQNIQLDGQIRAAYETMSDGEKMPVIILDTGITYVHLYLTRYHRDFVKELIARGKQHIRNLTLRVYHLPAAPQTSDYKGYPLHTYKANAYTLLILEPDILLNITDLNHAAYCSRQYLLNSLIASPPSAATIRGNLVHHCFKELLKDYDRGTLKAEPLETLQNHLQEKLEQSTIDLALASVSPDVMREEVQPHLESLARWFENQKDTLWDMPVEYIDNGVDEAHQELSRNQVRAETFLLAPEIGLRGRLDLFWQKSGNRRLLELKTGGKDNLPQQAHRWQIQGYHALLTVRRDSHMKKALGTLLYSGTPNEAQAFGIPFSVKDLQRVCETRNILLLSQITSIPSAPPGPRRCTKCAMLQNCTSISSLLDWQPPQPDPAVEIPHVQASELTEDIRQPQTPDVPVQPIITDAQRAFFSTYYHLLQLERRAIEQQLALLWQEPVAERVRRGATIEHLQLKGQKATDKGEWEQIFACENSSELREGDEILLSDGDPITRDVMSGTITNISTNSVTVWTPEQIAHPTLLDRYSTDLVHVRTVQNLLRWLKVDAHLQELIAGTIRPQFTTTPVPSRPDFNPEQNLAVERAVQMRDYLLVHGPPGTGKTSVIAEIVKRLCQQGQRVMLAAFTNQAVDNMLRRLDAEGFHDYVRLGHERSVHQDVQKHRLQELLNIADAKNIASNIHDLLQTTPVVASTTATWSSEKYIPVSEDSNGLQFDVAILDEASQLTIPAILGALRFAKRFILVGDNQQLPPLVQSKEASEQGLSDSLFSYLKQLDNGYMKEHLQEISACVPLLIQYRMNKWIGHFSSKVFYEDKLEADASVANSVLDVPIFGSWSSIEQPYVAASINPKYPLVFVNVSNGEAEQFKRSDAEARVVRDVVKGLLMRGIQEKDIGIIAPYRAQVANLRRHLLNNDPASDWNALTPDTAMSIDTVDRFQGGERPIIIMSFATTHAPEINNPLRQFLTNPNRLNVALTRAQRKLIVVGNVPALQELEYFNRLIAYCRSMKTIIECS